MHSHYKFTVSPFSIFRHCSPLPQKQSPRRSCFLLQWYSSYTRMAFATYNSPKSEKLYTDVLSNGRNSCYKARDSFYACIEDQSSKEPTESGSVGLLFPVECKKFREEYVKNCRPTWVKHFDRQYCAKKRVKRLLDSEESRKGPMSLPQPYTFKP